MTNIDALFRRIDTRLVYPPFLMRWRAVLTDAANEGSVFVASCGMRWPQDQLTDYLKGRETPGVNPRPEKPLGDVVTNARPYRSLHQYGIAGDSIRDGDPERPGLQPSWKRSDYAVLARMAEKHGLVSLGPTMHAWPHIEAPIAKHGLTLNLLQTTMKSARTPEEGLRRVWALFDERGVLRA